MPDERPQQNLGTADHDLLIRLDEKVENKFKALEGKIDDLSDNLVDRVNELESDFGDYKKSNDPKVSNLQKLVYIGLGIVLSLDFVIIVWVTYRGGH